MKKYIIGLLLAFPMLASAQSVQQNYQSALLQLIQLLTQEVNQLELQLANMAVSTPNPQQVLPVNQVFGNVENGDIIATSTNTQPMQPTATILVNGQSEINASSGVIPVISWTTQGVLDNSCSISAPGSWGGNWGINGSKKGGPFMASTTITLKCKVPVSDQFPDGKIVSTATINVQ